MKNTDACPHSGKNFSRRSFLKSAGVAAASLVLNPLIKSRELFAFTKHVELVNSAQVAVTRAFDYQDAALIKQKVQHLFESIGGISDVMSTGDKVAVKINLTGGMSAVGQQRLQGVDVRETTWTHPAVLRAVCELIIDSGVNAENIWLVEAIWDAASYNNFGYKDVQQDLGLQFINLNSPAPYSDFINKEVGDNRYYYKSFKLNPILTEVNAFISIPKMKQHYDAGVTHSMKNLVGIVPLEQYIMPGMRGYRSALHHQGGNIRTHLPRSICDLNMARPVNLAIIDGIKNAEGGEGPWNPTFKPAEYHLLLAGKDPVALDSIASFQMGNDPEAEKLQLPNGEECDNYLRLANQRGMGTNVLDEIELVGDGADLITSVTEDNLFQNLPETVQLYQNYPNPFNASTTIRYKLSTSGDVTIKIYNIVGQEIETLVNAFIPAGEHQVNWHSNNLPGGIYYYKIQAAALSDVRKLTLLK